MGNIVQLRAAQIVVMLMDNAELMVKDNGNVAVMKAGMGQIVA